MNQTAPSISDSEWRVMHEVWQCEPATSQQIITRLQDSNWSAGTKITFELCPQKPPSGSTSTPSISPGSSSRNEMLEAEEVGLVLVILNSRVTVSPGMTGSSMNSLLSLGTGSTERLSRAGLPAAVSPAMVAVMSLVAF